MKKGGDRCYALAGTTKYLCVTGGDRCYIVHPSDIGVALSVLDASVEIASMAGARTLAIGDFFSGPGRDPKRENVLEPGEIVTRVLLPASPARPEPLPQGTGTGIGRFCFGQRGGGAVAGRLTKRTGVP